MLFCAYCWRQLLSSNYKHHDFFRAFLWHCYVISAQENFIFSDIWYLKSTLEVLTLIVCEWVLNAIPRKQKMSTKERPGSMPLCISFSSLSLHQKEGVRFCVQKYKFIYSLNCQQLAGSNDVRTLKDLTLLVVRLECEGCSGKLSVLDSMMELHHQLDHLEQKCISVWNSNWDTISQNRRTTTVCFFSHKTFSSVYKVKRIRWIIKLGCKDKRWKAMYYSAASCIIYVMPFYRAEIVFLKILTE